MAIKKFEGKIEYKLVITYDSEKDEVMDISESVISLDEDSYTHHYGTIVLDDYWDDEAYEMCKYINEVGET